MRLADSHAAPSADQFADAQWTILCVDDEPNIVSSLRRVFRRQPYRVLTANSGGEGLRLLESEPVDVVISDMRMPEMDGTHFLEQVRDRWPGTVRLLLTGFADITSTIGAINRGEIYRYVAKPWDDDDIRTTVRQGIERKGLGRLLGRRVAPECELGSLRLSPFCPRRCSNDSTSTVGGNTLG